ncbi:hypothetical protein ACJX0J_026487, partial [Zea mays]
DVGHLLHRMTRRKDNLYPELSSLCGQNEQISPLPQIHMIVISATSLVHVDYLGSDLYVPQSYFFRIKVAAAAHK